MVGLCHGDGRAGTVLQRDKGKDWFADGAYVNDPGASFRLFARLHRRAGISGNRSRARQPAAAVPSRIGRDTQGQYRVDVRLVLSLDADFLMHGPAKTRYTRDFSRRRRPADHTAMNRLYVVETTPSNTGAMADHRLPLRPREIERFTRALAARLGLPVNAPRAEDLHGGFDAVVRIGRRIAAALGDPGDFQPAEFMWAHARSTSACQHPDRRVHRAVEAKPESIGLVEG